MSVRYEVIYNDGVFESKKLMEPLEGDDEYDFSFKWHWTMIFRIFS